MRKTHFALVSSLAFTASIGAAWAQTPAPATPPASTPPAATPPAAATPAPATPPPATPAPAAAPEPAPAAEATPAPEASPPPAPAAEEETFPAAWFRIDSDLLAVQLWAGATHPLSDTVGLATDMYVVGTIGEFDIGPAFTLGPVFVTPMIGLAVDWSQYKAVSVVPQFYVTGGPDPIYMELWVQAFLNTPFTEDAGNTLYGRFFIDYKLGKYIGIGPEVEATMALNDAAKANDKSLVSLPVGLNLMLSSYGKNNVMYIFGGYETQDTPSDTHLAGRLTFVHNF